MMYIVVTNITFTQQPTEDFPSRMAVLKYDFVNEYEASDSWADLTNKAKITLPKSVYIRNAEGKLISLSGPAINIGGFSTNTPLFLKGDKVTIEGGYRYFDVQGNEKLTTSVLFTGYISQVTSKKPVILECEDNMYILKQFIARGGKNGYFSGSTYTVESMLAEMIKNAGLPFTVNDTSQSNIGDFNTSNQSIAEVLSRIKNDFHFHAYFRGNELRVGSLVYLESDAVASGRKIFKFQQNIISDEFSYKRKDDIELSAVVKSVYMDVTDKRTKDGALKTKKSRLEVLITYRNGKVAVFRKDKGKHYPDNVSGERRELFFLNIKNVDKLIELGTNELSRYYYTGFRGKFTTFGIPYVRQGDNVDILDEILPERNGRYKVKSVSYKGGFDTGMRQEVELDYLLFSLDSKGNVLSTPNF